MGYLLGGSTVGLMATSSKTTYTTHHGSQVCYSQRPCPHGRPLLTCASAGDTQRQVWLSLLWGSLLLSLGPDVHKVLLASSECLW